MKADLYGEVAQIGVPGLHFYRSSEAPIYMNDIVK